MGWDGFFKNVIPCTVPFICMCTFFTLFVIRRFYFLPTLICSVWFFGTLQRVCTKKTKIKYARSKLFENFLKYVYFYRKFEFLWDDLGMNPQFLIFRGMGWVANFFEKYLYPRGNGMGWDETGFLSHCPTLLLSANF